MGEKCKVARKGRKITGKNNEIRNNALAAACCLPVD
jgi:hypothetical protein